MRHTDMDRREAQEALCRSIEHWLENWQKVGAAHASEDYCACCKAAGPDCEECLIAEFIGETACGGTPWFEANQYIKAYRLALKDNAKHREKAGLKQAAEDAVEAEYAFLWDVLFDE